VLRNISFIYDYTMCVSSKIQVILSICFVSCFFEGWFGLAKKEIKLFVRSRKQGSYIASVPLKKLDKFSKSPEKSRRWSFKDGWLILEAF